MLRTPTISPPTSIEELIGPDLAARLGSLDISSRRVFAGKLKGERRSKRKGDSVEFADHRSYVVGDDLRRIDWNIFGRLDRLFMKLFQEEEDLSLHIVIDCSASGACGEPNKFLWMQRAAASLGYIGLVNLNRVSLTAIADRPPAPDAAGTPRADSGGIVSVLRNLRAGHRAHDMGRWLCALAPEGGTNFTEAARRIALTRTGRGVMIVLSDFFFKEGYEDGLRALAGRGYDVCAIQVLSPQELDPPLGGDLRLKDVEDADIAEITISAPLLKRYKANLSAYCDRLRQYCAQRDMPFMTVQSDLPIETLTFDYLRRRGVLR